MDLDIERHDEDWNIQEIYKVLTDFRVCLWYMAEARENIDNQMNVSDCNWQVGGKGFDMEFSYLG
jgi:hypothetical protein